MLALLKEIFKPGTLSSDEDWYRGKPEWVSNEEKAEKYKRSNKLEFLELTKDKEVSFKGFQKLCDIFPDFTGLFDMGVRDFGDDSDSTTPCTAVEGAAKGATFMGNSSDKWGKDGKKPGTVPCMYCAAMLPHQRRKKSCVVEKAPRQLGADFDMEY